MPSAIVTGASGFIGNALTKKLIDSGWEVFTFSRTPKRTSSLNYKGYLIDWNDPDFTDLPKTDFVFHAASQNSNFIAQQNPLRDISNNLNVTLKLVAELERINHRPHFVYLSTASLYSISNQSEVNEDSTIFGGSFYDISKVTQENYLHYFFKQNNFSSLTILRLANVYGVTENQSRKDRGFLEKSIQSAIIGENIECFGDGKLLRDYIYIDDVIAAITAICGSVEDFNVYNVGTGTSIYLVDALRLALKVTSEIFRKDTKINFTPFPKDSAPSDLRSYTVDIEKLLALKIWKPKVSLEQGIRLIVGGHVDAFPS